jgi:hypothetical protein
MKLTKRPRSWLACLLAVVLLCTQLLTAAYACPAIAQALHQSDMVAMGCEGMLSGGTSLDAEQPGLCFDHCRADAAQQPADGTQLQLAAALLLALLLVLPMRVAGGASLPWRALRRRPARARPQPHRIEHCCFRN